MASNPGLESWRRAGFEFWPRGVAWYLGSPIDSILASSLIDLGGQVCTTDKKTPKEGREGTMGMSFERGLNIA